MKQLAELEAILQRLRFSETAKALPELLMKANEESPTYKDFLLTVFQHERDCREEKAISRRLKQASFPYYRPISEFQLSEQPSMSKKELNKLTDLLWIEQHYNLVLLGPTGTGKTMLSVGLGIAAIEAGFKVVFVAMGEMIHLLKTSDISRKSLARLKRLKDAQLIILDDLMFMAMNKEEANLFFHFINEVYEQASIILTSNKAPSEWGQLIGDEVITGAVLDRIIQKAEIIQLTGDSYRIKHRETIFGKTNNV
ncbi:hypothetical protein IGI37_000262 [Enterococcus sp. AZ194]|uniref:IS21-like element helper ATPase IstB n=1 Tax=Enterococcus sp. AZ194 TaxID=2774629 RepID=UPI003F22A89D